MHGLQLVGLEHIEGGGGEDEMAKATVQLLFEVEMVKRLDKVGPIQVCIDAEHLAEDGLADLDKVLGEPAAFANPVTTLASRSGQL